MRKDGSVSIVLTCRDGHQVAVTAKRMGIFWYTWVELTDVFAIFVEIDNN